MRRTRMVLSSIIGVLRPLIQKHGPIVAHQESSAGVVKSQGESEKVSGEETYPMM